MTNLILVEDNPSIRKNLIEILSNQDNINIISETLAAEEVLDFVRSNSVDLALIDINLKGIDGLTLTEQLKQEFEQLKIIMTSVYNHFSIRSVCVNCGADGFIAKLEFTPEQMEAEIKKVMQM